MMGWSTSKGETARKLGLETWFEQIKAVDRTMAAILGQEDEATTKIYTHQTAEHLKKSVNKVKI